MGKKNNRGRPTKYYPEIIDELYEYFDIPAFTQKKVENSKGEVAVLNIPAPFPTKAGFARKIGVSRVTLHEWSVEKFPEGHEQAGQLRYPEFSYAYNKIVDYQEDILVQNGLDGNYHANFAIFTAKNVIGYRDKIETEVKDVTPTDKKPRRIIIETVKPGKE